MSDLLDWDDGDRHELEDSELFRYISFLGGFCELADRVIVDIAIGLECNCFGGNGVNRDIIWNVYNNSEMNKKRKYSYPSF
jgi:hypothetical protein